MSVPSPNFDLARNLLSHEKPLGWAKKIDEVLDYFEF